MHSSLAAYIAAHRERVHCLLSADAIHYLSSPPEYITDLLDRLPDSPQAHNLRELYAYLADKDKTEDVANRLIAAILRLSHSKWRNPYANNGTAVSTGNSRQRFGRAPGDPTL